MYMDIYLLRFDNIFIIKLDMLAASAATYVTQQSSGDVQAQAYESSSRSIEPLLSVSTQSNISLISFHPSFGIGSKSCFFPKAVKAFFISSHVMVCSPVVNSLTIQSVTSFYCSGVRFSHQTLTSFLAFYTVIRLWTLAEWTAVQSMFWCWAESLAAVATPTRASNWQNFIFCFGFVLVF